MATGRSDTWSDILMAQREAIYRYAYSRLGPNLAEDVLSDTLTAAWKARRNFKGTLSVESTRPWILGVATMVIRQHRAAEIRWLRARASAKALPATSSDAFTDQVVERADAHERQATLVVLLESLHDEDRDLVVLNVVQGLSHAEIAAALEIPIGTVKSRLSRCMSKLRASAPNLVGETR